MADFVEENKFDIIFICVGIGADKLCNDDKVKPIRGQMIRVKSQNRRDGRMMKNIFKFR